MIPATARHVPAAFWLLPCDADAERLQAMVRALATAHAAPVFQPHVTMHVAECPAQTDVEGLLAWLADRHPALALAALATCHSEAYYKALFVNLSCELQDGAGLFALRSDLLGQLNDAAGSGAWAAARGRPAAAGPRAGAAPAPAYEFHPHVSLLYGSLPAQRRMELACSHDLSGHTLRFDRIAAVRPASGHRDLAQVANWEVYGHRRLRD